jgi:hypothetical protein
MTLGFILYEEGMYFACDPHGSRMPGLTGVLGAADAVLAECAAARFGVGEPTMLGVGDKAGEHGGRIGQQLRVHSVLFAFPAAARPFAGRVVDGCEGAVHETGRNRGTGQAARLSI